MSSDNQRKNIHSGAPWEPVFGYSRAVRMGRFVAVSGTAAVGADGELVGAGDMYAQTVQCLAVIQEALEAAGAKPSDVVRTRVYVTDIDRWEEVARAHQQVFGDVAPAATMVEVTRLIDPEMLVEIEADAIVAEA